MTIKKPALLKKDSTKTAQVALNSFFKIMTIWQVTIEDQQRLLGVVDLDEFKKMKSEVITQISDHILIRISYILKIYKYLHCLYPERTTAWIHRPNKAFDNTPALQIILLTPNEEGYIKVAKYLYEQYRIANVQSPLTKH